MKVQQPAISQLQQHLKGLNVMTDENAIGECNVDGFSADNTNYDDSLLHEPITEGEIIMQTRN